jgi:hypothetical protein
MQQRFLGEARQRAVIPSRSAELWSRPQTGSDRHGLELELRQKSQVVVVQQPLKVEFESPAQY